MKEMIKKNLTALSIMVGGIVMLMLLVLFKSSANEKASEERSYTITAQTVTIAEHAPQILLFGQVEAEYLSKLESRTAADIKHILVSRGHEVDKDQKLMQLDDHDASMRMMQSKAIFQDAEAKLASAKLKHKSDIQSLEALKKLYAISKKNVARQQKLNLSKVGSPQRLDEALSALKQQEISLNAQQYTVDNFDHQIQQLAAIRDQSKALYEIAKKDWEGTTIKAPFKGRITDVMVSLGDRAQMGEPLIGLYDYASLQIRALLPISYLDMFPQGEFKKDIKGLTTIAHVATPLKFDRISGELKSGKGGVDMYFRFLPPLPNIALGQTLKLYITFPTQPQTFVVPDTALYQQQFVYRIEENRLKAVKVNVVGIQQNPNNERSYILQSTFMSDGAQVLTSPLPNARTGLKVKVATS